jgi:hypothetical protein
MLPALLDIEFESLAFAEAVAPRKIRGIMPRRKWEF